MADILATNVSINKRRIRCIAMSDCGFYPDVRMDELLRAQAIAAARERMNLCGLFQIDDRKSVPGASTALLAKI
jgi:hypothetical protein